MKKLIIMFALLLAMPAIAANYTDWTQPFDVEPGKTMGLWHFDQTAGDNTAVDATANNNDATIDPNATAYDVGPLDPNLTWAPAKFGNGTWTEYPTNVGTLVAPQDGFETGNQSLLIDGDFSIDFWMNPTASSSGSWTHQILTKGTGSVFGVQFDYQKVLIYWYGVGTGWGADANANSGVVIPFNEWHHVSIRVQNKLGVAEDESYIEFWIDGALASSHNKAAFGDDPDAGYDLTILGPYGGHPFNAYKGQLDELRISNYFIPEPTTMSVFALALLAFLKRRK